MEKYPEILSMKENGSGASVLRRQEATLAQTTSSLVVSIRDSVGRIAIASGDGLAVKCTATANANLGTGSATSLDAGTAEIDIVYYVAE